MIFFFFQVFIVIWCLILSHILSTLQTFISPVILKESYSDAYVTVGLGPSMWQFLFTFVCTLSSLSGLCQIFYLTCQSDGIVFRCGAMATGAMATGAMATGVVAAGAVATGAMATGTMQTGMTPTWTMATGAMAIGTVVTGVMATGTKQTGTMPTGQWPLGQWPFG